jgi:putative oxidoreductase
MKIAFLIGRIIFAVFWLMSAANHFTKLSHMSGYAKAKGVPVPKLAVAGTGVLLLLGGASVLLGVCPAVGIILLIVFMLGTTFPMHNFWAVPDRR